MKTLLCAIVLAFTITSQATISYYNYTVKATMLVQDTEKGSTATKYKLTTKELLGYLSEAEFYAGNYTSSTFPLGARLVYEYDTITYDGRFIVQDSSRNFLCDVSDILWLEISDSVNIGYASIYKESLILDTTNVGMILSFKLDYLTTETENSAGINSCKGVSGVGTGYFWPLPMVLTGSCSSTTK